MLEEAKIAFNYTSSGEPIEVSSLDKRNYDVLTLPNGLKVILVSDPDAICSSAVMKVNVGNFNDPDKFLGLAHFLEHALFLGSKKYPDKRDFHNFIKDNGGFSNACTENLNTTFYFSISPSEFENALDRFAQFFIEPLFEPISLNNELKILHDEYLTHKHDDDWIISLILKFISNNKHPYSRFTGGNFNTLADKRSKTLLDAVKEFYYDYYSADKMVLVLTTNSNLHSLRKLAVNYFSQLPNRDAIELNFLEKPFTKNEIGKFVYINLISGVENLILNFPISINDINKKYAISIAYLTYMFNDKTDGGLYFFLINKFLASDCSFSVNPISNEQFLLTFNIELTEKGLNNIDYIIASIISFINFHKTKNISLEHYGQMINIYNTNLIYFEKNYDDVDGADKLIDNLLIYGVKYLISGSYFHFNENFKLINKTVGKLLNAINIDNMINVIVSPTVKTNKREFFLSGEYSVENITEINKKLWNFKANSIKFHYPQLKKFIPNEFGLKKNFVVNYIPDFIKIDSRTSLWHMLHTKFELPKSYILCYLNLSNQIETTLKNSVISDIYIMLINANILKNYGDFEGSSAEIYMESYEYKSLSIKIFGFSSNLDEILFAVQQQLFIKFLDENKFIVIKQELKQYFQNKVNDSTYKQLLGMLLLLNNKYVYTEQEIIKVLDEIIYDDILNYAADLLTKSRIEFIIVGNTNVVDAINMSRKFSKIMPKENKLNYKHRLFCTNLNLPNDDTNHIIYKNIDTDEHALLRVYYIKNPTRKEFALLHFLSIIIEQPFYNYSRVDYQLGYHVTCSVSKDIFLNNAYIYFYINSGDQHSGSIHKYLDTFIKVILNKYIHEMSLKKFNNFIKECTSVLGKDLSLFGVMSRIDFAVTSDLNFYFEKESLSIYKSIQQQEIINVYKKLMLNKNSCYLTICSESFIPEEQNYKIWDNVNDFKKTLLEADIQPIAQAYQQRFEQFSLKSFKAANNKRSKTTKSFDDSVVFNL